MMLVLNYFNNKTKINSNETDNINMYENNIVSKRLLQHSILTWLYCIVFKGICTQDRKSLSR